MQRERDGPSAVIFVGPTNRSRGGGAINMFVFFESVSSVKGLVDWATNISFAFSHFFSIFVYFLNKNKIMLAARTRVEPDRTLHVGALVRSGARVRLWCLHPRPCVGSLLTICLQLSWVLLWPSLSFVISDLILIIKQIINSNLGCNNNHHKFLYVFIFFVTHSII